MWANDSVKIKLVCLTLNFVVLSACGKDDKDKITAKNYIHYLSGGVCTETAVPLPPTAEQLEDAGAETGLCPATITVGTQTATLVKTCNPVTTTDEGVSSTTVSKIYSKFESEDGTVIDVTAETATSLCTQIETAN